MPKPIVSVAGVPLIERVVRSFASVGIRRLQVIFNEEDKECVAFIQERFPNLDIHCLVKTTRSSYESFWEVGQRLGPARTLISTVDWICSGSAFRRFVQQAWGYSEASIVLAVTTWAGKVEAVFQVIGASFGPVCGAMAADFLLSGKKWAGPRAGFNPAGWISWAVGFAVGAAGFYWPSDWPAPDRTFCPPVAAFLVGFVLYYVLAKAGLQSKSLGALAEGD